MAIPRLLILAVRNSANAARMEWLVRDRLNGPSLPGIGAATPDANTIRFFVRSRPKLARLLPDDAPDPIEQFADPGHHPLRDDDEADDDEP